MRREVLLAGKCTCLWERKYLRGGKWEMGKEVLVGRQVRGGMANLNWRRRGGTILEDRWLNGSAPDC
jgi:hypothetical protein